MPDEEVGVEEDDELPINVGLVGVEEDDELSINVGDGDAVGTVKFASVDGMLVVLFAVESGSSVVLDGDEGLDVALVAPVSFVAGDVKSSNSVELFPSIA